MLRVHNDATADLKAIDAADPVSGKKLIAFVQQLRYDPQLLSKLNEEDYGNDGSGPIGVKRWVTMRAETGGKPVRRVRVWSLEKMGIRYRLIFVYNWPDQSFNLIGVIARSELDYDDSSNQYRRRIRACIDRDFPKA